MTEKEAKIIRDREQLRIIDLKEYADSRGIPFERFSRAVEAGLTLDEWKEHLESGPPTGERMHGQAHAFGYHGA